MNNLKHAFFVLPLLAAAAHAADLKAEMIARMNKAAEAFKAMTAEVTYLTHTDVLNDNSTESGSVVMKKVLPGEVQGLIDFTKTADKRTVTFEKRRVRVFYPKTKIVQEYDLGEQGEQLDQFLMIGFGTSGTALARDYSMKVFPPEPLKGRQGVQAVRLELIPAGAKAREYIKKLELWVPTTGEPYPLEEKISQPNGDYREITYSDLEINPRLRPDALQLKLPAGVVVEHPGK